jgi:hypothetical protein
MGKVKVKVYKGRNFVWKYVYSEGVKALQQLPIQ